MVVSNIFNLFLKQCPGGTVTDDWLQEVLAMNVAKYTAWDSDRLAPKPNA